LPQVLTGDDFAGVLEQKEEKAGWLLLEFDGDAIPAQFSCTSFYLEGAETPDRKAPLSADHRVRSPRG
jgi:hypothetical protein